MAPTSRNGLISLNLVHLVCSNKFDRVNIEFNATIFDSENVSLI